MEGDLWKAIKDEEIYWKQNPMCDGLEKEIKIHIFSMLRRSRGGEVIIFSG